MSIRPSVDVIQIDSKENSINVPQNNQQEANSSSETVIYSSSQKLKPVIKREKQQTIIIIDDQNEEKELPAHSINSSLQNINSTQLQQQETNFSSSNPLPNKKKVLIPQSLSTIFQKKSSQSHQQQQIASDSKVLLCESPLLSSSSNSSCKQRVFHSLGSLSKNAKQQNCYVSEFRLLEKDLSCEIVEQKQFSHQKDQNHNKQEQQEGLDQSQYDVQATNNRFSKKSYQELDDQFTIPKDLLEYNLSKQTEEIMQEEEEEEEEEGEIKESKLQNLENVQIEEDKIHQQIYKEEFNLEIEKASIPPLKNPAKNQENKQKNKIPLKNEQNPNLIGEVKGYYEDSDFSLDNHKQLSHTDDLLLLLKRQSISVAYIESSSNSLISELIPDNSNGDNQSKEFDAIVKEIFHNSNGKHSGHCYELQNEVKILNIIKHKFIIQLIQKNLIKLPKSCCVFMSKAKMDLFDFSLLRKNTCEINRGNFQCLRTCFKQIAQALHYLHYHKNMIHGDIKPENILVFSNSLFKLGDFGFSKNFSSFKTRQEFVQRFSDRSLKYYPPEYIDALESYYYELSLLNEFKADVFALGITIFYCFFKVSPFADEKYFCRYKKVINGNENKGGQMEQEDQEEDQFAESRKYYHRDDVIYGILYNKKKRNFFWNNFYQEENQMLKGTGALTSKEYSQLQDLIIQCITPDISQRFNIIQVLNHPFLNSIL